MKYLIQLCLVVYFYSVDDTQANRLLSKMTKGKINHYKNIAEEILICMSYCLISNKKLLTFIFPQYYISNLWSNSNNKLFLMDI